MQKNQDLTSPCQIFTQIIEKLEATLGKSWGIVINCQRSWRNSADRQGVNLVLF